MGLCELQTTLHVMISVATLCAFHLPKDLRNLVRIQMELFNLVFSNHRDANLQKLKSGRLQFCVKIDSFQQQQWSKNHKNASNISNFVSKIHQNDCENRCFKHFPSYPGVLVIRMQSSKLGKKSRLSEMANAAQSRATSPLFFLKTGWPNKILVASGNRATGQPLISSTAYERLGDSVCIRETPG